MTLTENLRISCLNRIENDVDSMSLAHIYNKVEIILL